jgi:hypothetical protein
MKGCAIAPRQVIVWEYPATLFRVLLYLIRNFPVADGGVWAFASGFSPLMPNYIKISGHAFD